MYTFETVTVHLIDGDQARDDQKNQYGILLPAVLKAVNAALQALPFVASIEWLDDFAMARLTFKEPVTGDLDALEYDLEGKILDALGGNKNLVDSVVLPTFRLRRRNGEITE